MRAAQLAAASLGREAGRRLRLILAKAWITLRPRAAAQLRQRRSWLIGGSVGAIYGDNSAALHRHLRSHHPGLDVLWVINRDSADVDAARAIGPVLFRDDWRTVVRALLAETIVISHGAHDVPGTASRWCGAFRVRVGHGLTALKKTRARVLHSNESANAIFDLVPVSSPLEHQIKQTWGVPADRIVIAGVPRFDTLLAKQAARLADPKLIIYMPTWRDEIAEGSATARIAFFQSIDAFLDSPALQDHLEEQAARIRVVLHQNLRNFAGPWVRTKRHPRVEIDSMASDPQDLFVEAGILITDYSSVTWDFLFVDKPVLFYQFDREDFDRSRGGYIDEADGPPGPVATTPPELIANLRSCLTGDLARDEMLQKRIAKWKADVFPFRDAGACARIVDAILERLAARTSSANSSSTGEP
jgi:CDP-glycerol glycerophosphotransferase